MAQTGHHPFSAHNCEFKGKELSVLRVERKRAAVVGVIREFEDLSEKDLEKACVFTT